MRSRVRLLPPRMLLPLVVAAWFFGMCSSPCFADWYGDGKSAAFEVNTIGQVGPWFGVGASGPFALDTNGSNGTYDLSDPFALDTTLPDQLWGYARNGQTQQGLSQAMVEVLHGGSPVRYVFTDQQGRFGFTGLNPGGYVLRATRQGYVAGTTDLVQIGGAQAQADIALAPLAAGELPDLAVQASDLTYTVLQDGRVTVTGMIRNLGQAALDVPIRFLASNGAGGGNQTQPMGSDQILPGILPGACLPVTLTWTPVSGYDRFYCVVNPDAQVVEVNYLNNAAWRELGTAWAGHPPVVTAVNARWDGDPSGEVIGRFLSGVDGENEFRATVEDPDGDVSKVEFKFGNIVIVDDSPSGGWTVSQDVGEFGPEDVTLAVTAIDATGLRSAPKVVTIDMEPQPEWMTHFDSMWWAHWPRGGAIQQFRLGGPNRNFAGYTGRIMLSKLGGGSAIEWAQSLPNDWFLIRGQTMSGSSSLFLDLNAPLAISEPWSIKGAFDCSGNVFGKLVPKWRMPDCWVPEGGVSVAVSVTPDGRVITGAAFSVHGELAVGYSLPPVGIPVAPGLDVILGIGFDVLLGGQLTLSADQGFSQYHVSQTAELGGQLRVTAGLEVAKFARAEFVGMPALLWNARATMECRLHPELPRQSGFCLLSLLAFPLEGRRVGGCLRTDMVAGRDRVGPVWASVPPPRQPRLPPTTAVPTQTA